ncbi:hypothetical protein [Methylococcus sp. Mc7]|uniref:hypothetical protein n=1 Tax=Methylococcus sp. Mc7 TaxID=2860258 RepID=UPI001C52E620|nr:hypothetical protein [Methylococcus sp. Mc7]QXP85655.1 hypothetical protein KW115_08105 [Methylococcus sp. Mc7]
MSVDKGLYRTHEATLSGQAALGFEKKYEGHEIELTAVKLKGTLPSTEHVRTPQMDAIDLAERTQWARDQWKVMQQRDRHEYLNEFEHMESSFQNKKSEKRHQFSTLKHQNDLAAWQSRQTSVQQPVSSNGGGASIWDGAAQVVMPMLTGIAAGAIANRAYSVPGAASSPIDYNALETASITPKINSAPSAPPSLEGSGLPSCELASGKPGPCRR